MFLLKPVLALIDRPDLAIPDLLPDIFFHGAKFRLSPIEGDFRKSLHAALREQTRPIRKCPQADPEPFRYLFMSKPFLSVPDELDPFVQMRFLHFLQKHPDLFFRQILNFCFCFRWHRLS
jgi:hypothetical protein